MPDLRRKSELLKSALRDMGGLAVAFSGGVDSTFLLKTARDVLGDKCVAVTARSALFPKKELDEAAAFAASAGAEHIIFDFDEASVEGFSKNPADRCYICKKKIFGEIIKIAAERGIAFVADGSNADDAEDYRPGMKAAAELGVKSPLRDAGLTKGDIRQLSREIGLQTWGKPSLACLATRFPYGEEITAERLGQVGAAESFLLESGFGQVRVRHHGALARIETDESGFALLNNAELRGKIHARFKELGFFYTSIDLIGYRTGSMDETL